MRPSAPLVLAGCLLAGPALAADGACRTAEDYVARVNRRDARAVAALFAEKVEFRTPYGAVLRSRSEIEAFYARVLGTSAAGVRAASYLAADDACTFELEAQMKPDGAGGHIADPSGDWLPTSVDIAWIDGAGRIARMNAYPAPRSRWQGSGESATGGGRLP